MAKTEQSLPTILVVGNDGSLDYLIKSLQLDGYLVLVAMDRNDAVRVAAIHSRPIHVLLTHHSMSAHGLAETLKPFRLDPMQVVHVNGSLNDALEEVREHVKRPIAPPPGQKGQAA